MDDHVPDEIHGAKGEQVPNNIVKKGCTNAYDEPIGNLDKMGDEVENMSPQSTPQVLPSFEEYTPPVTYPKEVEETLGTPMEVEPLDQTKLEDVVK
nr:ribonuclease H-like domain-containing protein [Tanacetum cinerariifolium]